MNKITSKPQLKERPFVQILLFLPLILFMSGDMAALIANQMLIVAELGIDFQQMGIIIAIQYIFQGAFTFVFGYMSDRWSRKKLLVIGGTIWVIGDFLTAIAPNFTILLLARLFAAIGLGVQGPVTFSMLSDLFPSDNRSNSFAWWGIVNMIGSIAVGAIALSFNRIPTDLIDTQAADFAAKLVIIKTQYADLLYLWRMPYYLLCGFGAICVILALFVREPKRAAKDKQLESVLANEKVDYSKSYQIKIEDLKILAKRKTNIYLVINFVDNVVSGVIVSYLFTYLTFELGFSINFASINSSVIFLIFGLVVALGIALWGQFYFSKLGDKLKNKGDPAGRIKVMTFCGIFMIPFIAIGFMIAPSVGKLTLFKGSYQPGPTVFWIIFMVMFILIGIGLAGSFGGTPNWYASLIDGNLPEHRGTMIAMASLMDTIGRAMGAAVGGYFLNLYQGNGDPAPLGSMFVTMSLIFGIISALITIPAIYTAKKDFPEVEAILAQRAEELKKKVMENQENKEQKVDENADKKNEKLQEKK